MSGFFVGDSQSRHGHYCHGYALALLISGLLMMDEASALEFGPVRVKSDYYLFGLTSSETVAGQDDSAAAGIARVTIDWLAFQDESDLDMGSFRLRVDHKHKYTEATPSQFMMSNLGGFGLIQPAFSDIGLRLTNLYWSQTFNEQDTELMIGFLDSTDYIDTYALGNPYSGFSNLQFSTGSGSIAIPDESTFGLSVRQMMSENYYFYFSFSDAKADSTDPFEGVKNFVRDNQYFKSLEIGWVPSKDAFYMQNAHLTLWHSDGSKVNPSENYGVNWSTIYNVGNWAPFFRAGFAKGPEALYKSSAVVGTGYLGLGHGTLGVAAGWAEPNAPFEETYNVEVYYQMKFGLLSLTPSLQYINNLPFSISADEAWVFGLRGHVSLDFF